MFKHKLKSVVEEVEDSVHKSDNIKNIDFEVFSKCKSCMDIKHTDDFKENKYVCPKCGYYMRLDSNQRLQMICDENSFIEWDTKLTTRDPMKFPGYIKKVTELREKIELNEAVKTGYCTIGNHPVVICVMDTKYLMGSLGWATGEKITRAIEKATEKKLPIIIFTCSGGARMQEGIISLMQMEKTSAALRKHSDKGLLYISVLTDPTTGGVTASFAMLGDIILSEPKALVGFAGKRVIEQTIHQKIQEGFQSAEFMQQHGFIDKIVPRKEMREVLIQILYLHTKSSLINMKYESHLVKSAMNSTNGDAWSKTKQARKIGRPVANDYIDNLFDKFIEFKGDRLYADDKSVIGGIGEINGVTVTIIGQSRGKNIYENIDRNFGMMSPEGYRKALRLMKQAEKFCRPIVCFIDTPGAYCGVSAEERGQGEAIARNLFEMSGLKVPILSIIIGEAESGGALALGIGNEVWMYENSIYSVLSPEGFASILWKDAHKAEDAAKVMKITANELLSYNIIDGILNEHGEICNHFDLVIKELKDSICYFIDEYRKYPTSEIVERRYRRFRNM